MSTIARATKCVEIETDCVGLDADRTIQNDAQRGARPLDARSLANVAAAPPERGELIDRLRAGDPVARTAVVRRYHSALVHQACRILRDRGLAEDAVQDSWLAAFACIDNFQPRSSLLTWLIRIVINKAKTVRRREMRSVPFSAWAPRTSAGPGDEERELPGLASNDASPEWLLLEQEVLRRFRDALQALPERQRAVVLLRDLAGASPAEACRALQINDLAQRVRLCRARKSIRQAL
jgi:RNA polymerase sigma-70 factor (ECF subfamily)